MRISTLVTSTCVSLLTLRAGFVALGCVSMLTGVLAQAAPPAADQQRRLAYEAVAIRRNVEGLTFGSIGTLPDGTFRGSYRIKLAVGLMSPALSATAIDSPPTVFTALSDLGLKLQSSRAPLDVLVIDRMERPSEN